MVSMDELKKSFEQIGLSDVTTYLNSGNVIIRTSEPRRRLPQKLEEQIQLDFGLSIKVLLRSLPEMEALVHRIPNDFVNDATYKCDVIFLWPEVDAADAFGQLSWDHDHETLDYMPGALVWHTTKAYAATSKILYMNQLPLYQSVTVRNPNTVRKL